MYIERLLRFQSLMKLICCFRDGGIKLAVWADFIAEHFQLLPFQFYWENNILIQPLNVHLMSTAKFPCVPLFAIRWQMKLTWNWGPRLTVLCGGANIIIEWESQINSLPIWSKVHFVGFTARNSPSVSLNWKPLRNAFTEERETKIQYSKREEEARSFESASQTSRIS